MLEQYTTEDLLMRQKWYEPLTAIEWRAFFHYVDLSKLPPEMKRKLEIDLFHTAEQVPFLRKMVRDHIVSGKRTVVTAIKSEIADMKEKALNAVGMYETGKAHIILSDTDIVTLHHELLHARQETYRLLMEDETAEMTLLGNKLNEAEALPFDMMMKEGFVLYGVCGNRLIEKKQLIADELKQYDKLSFPSVRAQEDFIKALEAEILIGETIDILMQPTMKDAVEAFTKHRVPVTGRVIDDFEFWHNGYNAQCKEACDTLYEVAEAGLSDMQKKELNRIQAYFEKNYPILRGGRFMTFQNAFHTGRKEWLYAPAESVVRDELNEPIYMMSRQSDGSYQEILNYGKDKVFSRVRYYSPTGLTQREEFYQKHQDAPVSQIMNIVADSFSGAINPYQFSEINKQETAHLYRVNQYEDGLISQAEFFNPENQRCFIEHWDRSVHSPEENYILYKYKLKDGKIIASETKKYPKVNDEEEIFLNSLPFNPNMKGFISERVVCRQGRMHVESYDFAGNVKRDYYQDDYVVQEKLFDADGRLQSFYRKNQNITEKIVYYSEFEKKEKQSDVKRRINSVYTEKDGKISQIKYRKDGSLLSKTECQAGESCGVQEIYAPEGYIRARGYALHCPKTCAFGPRIGWTALYQQNGAVQGYRYRNEKGEKTGIAFYKNQKIGLDVAWYLVSTAIKMNLMTKPNWIARILPKRMQGVSEKALALKSGSPLMATWQEKKNMR